LSRFARLSLADRSNLRIERPETPAHVAGLCVVEAWPLLDSSGELDLATIRRRLDRRLARAPELRGVVHRPPPLCGPALWVDDPGFSIGRHVHAVRVAPPGDEASLLDTAERLLRPPLERSHPLWELWFLTGLRGDRLGALFKIHHAVADGLAAIALIASLLDMEPGAADPPAAAWRPEPPPPILSLLADSVRCRAASAASLLGHPLRLARGVGSAAPDTAAALRGFTAAPRTSLSALPGSARLIRVVHLDLERARAIAHAHAGKVNDVVLAVVAGGVRELLAGRGELVDGMELRVSVPAALRRAGVARELGNAVGVIVVSLPVSEPDPIRRLERIAAASVAAKAAHHPAYVQDLMSCLAAAGLALPLARRQRMVNFFVTNVPGPRDALYLLGARIEAVLPVTGLAGNVTITVAALSYRGRLEVAIDADAAACPDVDVLVAGMERAWAALTSGARAA
jgi:WS/DGAT/MGAT family acyltransferase